MENKIMKKCIFALFILLAAVSLFGASDSTTFEFYATKMNKTGEKEYSISYKNLYNENDPIIVDEKVFQAEYADLYSDKKDYYVDLYEVVFEANYLDNLDIGISFNPFQSFNQSTGEYGNSYLGTSFKWMKKIEFTDSNDNYPDEVKENTGVGTLSANNGENSQTFNFEVEKNNKGVILAGKVRYIVEVAARVNDTFDDFNLAGIYRMPVTITVQGN